MLKVFVTFDVEIWCNGWRDIDDQFPQAFRRYVHGPTKSGDFGLGFQARLLRQHELTGVFFVEPLFATRFGAGPLAEIVAVVRDQRQETQLHLHTEWVDEARPPLLAHVREKRQHLRYFSRADQTSLIKTGSTLLQAAGAAAPSAFRAGSFAFNRDTLGALADNGIAFDSSYNACLFGPDSGVLPGTVAVDPFVCDDVSEYPMTVFRDGFGKLRHAQLGACSYAEIEGLLWQARDADKQAFVILMHNFELMNSTKTRPDWVMVRRFEKLCAFLARHRDQFDVRGFDGLPRELPAVDHHLLHSYPARTAGRVAEQAYRRIYR